MTVVATFRTDWGRRQVVQVPGGVVVLDERGRHLIAFANDPTDRYLVYPSLKVLRDCWFKPDNNFNPREWRDLSCPRRRQGGST